MERRMGNYGNRVVAPYSMYPGQSFSHSPIKNNSYITYLHEKVEDLSMQAKQKRKSNKEQAVMGSLVSLLDHVVSARTDTRTTTPVPQKQNTEMNGILMAFQKQQDMMLQLMQNMNTKTVKQYKRKKTSEKGSIEAEYQKIKTNPEEIKKMLAELNFDDDGAEDYADKEKKLKFNANLTDLEKQKIVKKLEKNKLDRISARVEHLKGISRFRVIGWTVLFPILIVSSLLENRAKQSVEGFSNMSESLNIYLDVGRSWVLRAMKTVLVSTINDPNLDLGLSIKESEIRNQTANSKIIKLQVRISGILEGLENLTNEKEMQLPFRKFIDSYVSNKAYLPKNTLTGFEFSRIEMHEFGGLINQNEDKKKMMISFFFISKILVKQICLKPVEAGLPIVKGSKAVM